MDVETKEQIAAVEIKKEKTDDHNELPELTRTSTPASVIDISSTDSDDSDDDSDVEEILRKRRKLDGVLPLGFLDPIRPEERMIVQTTPAGANTSTMQSNAEVQSCRQFWKAGDYEGDSNNAADFASHSGNNIVILA